jgi:hypothetical protein
MDDLVADRHLIQLLGIFGMRLGSQSAYDQAIRRHMTLEYLGRYATSLARKEERLSAQIN